MNRGTLQAVSILTLTTLFVSGCATTRARRPDPATSDTTAQMAAMQSELASKDRQIQELQAKLDSYQRALESPRSNFSSGNSSSDFIRVSGVSVSDVQRALRNAGFDPGPVDGKAGKKTKSALREFQRSKGLSADGVLGQKTWSALR